MSSYLVHIKCNIFLFNSESSTHSLFLDKNIVQKMSTYSKVRIVACQMQANRYKKYRRKNKKDNGFNLN